MSLAGTQDVWYETQSHLDTYSNNNYSSNGCSDHSFSADRYMVPAPRKNIAELCRELSSRFSRRSDKSSQYVTEIIKALFYDPEIDLCGILQNSPDGSYEAVRELIDLHSNFFDIFFDGNEKFVAELWKGLYHQVQNCHLAANVSRESVLMHCISGYVVRLLPTDSCDQIEAPRASVRQRVHTPLDLFLPSSPILNRIRFDQDVDRFTTSTLHPRHLTMFCNMVTMFCSVEEFPSPSRLAVLRHLIRQFHLFCTFETTDPDMIAIKNAVFSNPPFSGALYNFYFTFMEQCPSTTSLQDLIASWASYCRPWRYAQDDCPDVTRSPQYVPFFKSQERFYRILLGKILRKLSEHDINVTTAKTIKTVLDLTWKEPMCSLLRKLLCLDTRPAARKLLTRVSDVYRTESLKVKIAQQETSQSWWKAFLGQTESPSTENSRTIVSLLEPILREADAFMGTNFLPEANSQTTSWLRPDETHASVMTSSVATDLNETPKRGLLPDHEKDPVTGLMYATAAGRNQILSKQRRFNFSPCHSYIPSWQSPARSSEFPPMVFVTKRVAGLLNGWKPVQELGKHYYDGGALGAVARVLMDPPCPNAHSTVASPVFSRSLKKTPPTLRVRVLANNTVLISLFFVFLFAWLGLWALVPLILFLLVLLCFYLGTLEETS